MVRFKSWKDMHLFIKEYANCSCLNCHYSGKKDANEKTGYSRVFCMHHIAMVELAFQMCCGEWKHRETGKSLEDYKDSDLWKLSDDVLDALNETEKLWTIDEVRNIVDESKGTGETA